MLIIQMAETIPARSHADPDVARNGGTGNRDDRAGLAGADRRLPALPERDPARAGAAHHGPPRRGRLLGTPLRPQIVASVRKPQTAVVTSARRRRRRCPRPVGV